MKSCCYQIECKCPTVKAKKFDKMVRDKIPEILRADPNVESFLVEQLPSSRLYAREKLVEEAKEAANAIPRDELLAELGDLLEVMLKVAKDNNIKFEEILFTMVEKQQKCGKFDKNIILKEIVYK